jgi:chromosome segregation ATPase
VDALLQSGTPAGLLLRAREALVALEREEAEARQQLLRLETQEEQLALEMRRAMERVGAAPGPSPAARIDALSGEREELLRQKGEQWGALRAVRERLHGARRRWEGLQRQAQELHHAIRREERLVAQWQRNIQEAEEQLARWQRLLAGAQARLAQARQELDDLTG